MSYFFGFWCQLGSNLAPNLGPKPGQMKTESNFWISFVCGMLQTVCNCFFVLFRICVLADCWLAAGCRWLVLLLLMAAACCCCWLLPVCCWLLAAGCLACFAALLLVAGCCLLAAGCLLLAAGCLLRAAGCLLRAACCLLLAACCRWLELPMFAAG